VAECEVDSKPTVSKSTFLIVVCQLLCGAGNNKGRKGRMLRAAADQRIMDAMAQLSGAQETDVPRAPAIDDRARERFAKRLCDLVLRPAQRINAQQRSLIDEALCVIVPELSNDFRKRLAARMATTADAPRNLCFVLACDDSEVAAEILRHSLALTDSELIEVATRGTIDHWENIACRERISSPVCDALLTNRDRTVALRILKNEGAEISGRSIIVLGRWSERDGEMARALLRRPEVTPMVAFRLFWHVDAFRRKEILTRYSIDRADLQKGLNSGDVESYLGPEADPLIAQVAATLFCRRDYDRADTAALHDCVIHGRAGEFLNGMARASALSLEMVRYIIADAGGEPLAVLCKAVGFSRSQFAETFALFEQARNACQTADSDLPRVAALFDSLSTDRADSILGQWHGMLS
jgi:uncharacterized protein (DUF2336 family)